MAGLFPLSKHSISKPLITNKLCKNILISFFIIGLYTWLLFIYFYPSKSELGESFGVIIMYTITRYSALICGAGVLILRFLKIIESPSALLYQFFAIFNILLGLLGIYFFLFQHWILLWLHESLLNLLMGAIILSDGVLFYQKNSSSVS
jgi:hypothetical protein